MGTRFGKFELVSPLGRGGMAETWLARQRHAAGVTKVCVLKKVLPELAEQPEFVDAFIAEATLSATLSHGNIAQVFEFGEVDGVHYLTMEWVHGRSLADLIRRAWAKGFWHLPFPIAAYVAAQALKGLHHAHTRVREDGRPLQLVHRDVSPDNVLLSYEGEVKVADFGIAKAQLAGRQETQPGLVKGKYHYFSPEQAAGRAVDARSDLYSLGVVLYVMVCGRLPSEGELPQVLSAIATGKHPHPRELNPDCPEELSDVIQRSLAVQPASRFPTAQKMQEALTRYLYQAAPTFSEDRLKGLLEHLFFEEMVREGLSPRPREELEAQLMGWRPARARPWAVDPETTIRELEPVRSVDSLPPVRGPAPAVSLSGLSTTDTEKSGRSGTGRALWAALGLLVVALGGGTAVLVADVLEQPPPQPTQPTPLAVVAPAPRVRPVEAEPQPVPVAPSSPRPPDPAPSWPRAIRLDATVHVVSPTASLARVVPLKPNHTYRVQALPAEGLLSRLALQAVKGPASGWQPISDRVPQEVTGASELKVACTPGPQFSATSHAVLEVFDVTEATRVSVPVEVRRCWDLSAGKLLELDGSAYRLSLGPAAQGAAGHEPTQVAWRTSAGQRLRSGILVPGGSVELVDVEVLEVGLLDEDVADNRGVVELTLEPSTTRPREAPASAGRRTMDQRSVDQAIRRAMAALTAQDPAQAIDAVKPCATLARPVPNCLRLLGKAYYQADQLELGRAAFVEYLRVAPASDPFYEEVKGYVTPGSPTTAQ